ncbi:MAG: hypothetical protein ABIP97_10055 [Chthoniobacterales bacterium]
MKTLQLLIATLVLSATVSLAGSNLPNITPQQASQYLGKKAVVTGRVTEVISNEKGNFIKFAKKGSHGFTAVILDASRSQFPNYENMQRLTGRNISVSGRIDRDMDGNPNIIVDSRGQIRLAK